MIKMKTNLTNLTNFTNFWNKNYNYILVIKNSIKYKVRSFSSYDWLRLILIRLCFIFFTYLTCLLLGISTSLLFSFKLSLLIIILSFLLPELYVIYNEVKYYYYNSNIESIIYNIVSYTCIPIILSISSFIILCLISIILDFILIECFIYMWGYPGNSGSSGGSGQVPRGPIPPRARPSGPFTPRPSNNWLSSNPFERQIPDPTPGSPGGPGGPKPGGKYPLSWLLNQPHNDPIGDDPMAPRPIEPRIYPSSGYPEDEIDKRRGIRETYIDRFYLPEVKKVMESLVDSIEYYEYHKRRPFVSERPPLGKSTHKSTHDLMVARIKVDQARLLELAKKHPEIKNSYVRIDKSEDLGGELGTRNYRNIYPYRYLTTAKYD